MWVCFSRPRQNTSELCKRFQESCASIQRTKKHVDNWPSSKLKAGIRIRRFRYWRNLMPQHRQPRFCFTSQGPISGSGVSRMPRREYAKRWISCLLSRSTIGSWVSSCCVRALLKRGERRCDLLSNWNDKRGSDHASAATANAFLWCRETAMALRMPRGTRLFDSSCID